MDGAAAGAAGLIGFVIAFVVAFVIFLVMREVWCWYWKINAALLELGLIRIELEKMNAREARKVAEATSGLAPDGFPPIR